MPLLGTVLLGAFLVIVFPLRSLRLRRRHRLPAGRTRPRRRRPRVWVAADILFVLGFGALLAGAVAESAGALPVLAEPAAWVRVLGVASVVASTVLAVWAQEAMGAAWVADIAPRAKSDGLVTGGPFQFVRNPNYVAMLAAGGGAVVLAFDAITVLGWMVLLVSLLLTSRAEEAVLREHFGSAYEAYAARTGRFIPGVGRLP